jgi:hypothetical protein
MGGMDEQIWSGLAHVIPKTTEPLSKGAAGGYVNVVALAMDRADFLRRVSEAFDKLDLQVTEIEDAVLLDGDDSHERVNKEVLALSEEILPDCRLRFGVIHTYVTDTDIN